MEGETWGIEAEKSGIETSQNSIKWKCDPIPGASGDYVIQVITSSDNAVSPDSSMLSVDVQPLHLGDNRLYMTTEGGSVALPRTYRNARAPAPPHILMAGGTDSSQEGPSSTSDGRNRGPPASSEQDTEQDRRTPRRSFQEFLPLLLFAIGTVTILRVAAHRGKIPKA